MQYIQERAPGFINERMAHDEDELAVRARLEHVPGAQRIPAAYKRFQCLPAYHGSLCGYPGFWGPLGRGRLFTEDDGRITAALPSPVSILITV